MGRTFLSVKLAVVFSVSVAVAVTVHGRVTADVVPPEASEAPAAAALPGGGEVQEAVTCLWRGCPAVLTHPLLRASVREAALPMRATRAT
jgi:hypothetical protein